MQLKLFEPAVPHLSSLLLQKNMWTCTHCLVSNNASDDKCVACHSDSAVGQACTASKPDGAVDEVTETLEETTLEGSIGSGRFTFGPAVSNED